MFRRFVCGTMEVTQGDLTHWEVSVCALLNRHMCIEQTEPDEDDMRKKHGGEQFSTLFHAFYSTMLSKKSVQNLKEKQECRLVTGHV